MPKHVGLDLGTSNTRMFVKGKGIILRSPTVVTIDKEDDSVVAIGRDAKAMIGKTPSHMEAYRPIRNGVIAVFEVTTLMLREFFVQKEVLSLFNRPVVLVSTPESCTEVERLAVENAIFAAGAKAVGTVKSSIASAVGAGLMVNSPKGCMIVDIGGGTTEVAVISLGGIVASKSLRVAGDNLDKSIIQYLRVRKNILIGEITAEELKGRIGSAHPSTDKGRMTVFGRNVNSGLAATEEITSEDIRLAMREELEQIVGAIKSTLEETPPELSADIYDHGIILTGGCSMIRGIGRLITERTGIRVTIAKNPLDSVCLGIGRVIESEGALGNLLKYRGR
jgi:rod shape-determining protein MreB